jgi:hypothetical protein
MLLQVRKAGGRWLPSLGSRQAQVWAAAGLLVLLPALLTVTLHRRTRQQSVEWLRWSYDALTCTPVYADFLTCAGFTLAPSPSDEASSTGCPRVQVAAALPALPTIYIADREVLPLFAGAECSSCDEDRFLELLRRNATGSLVRDPAAAEFIFVPFPASCRSCARPQLVDFDKGLQAIGHLPGRRFTIHRRPWTERTNARTEMRQLLQRHPDVVFLSPEIKNVQTSELISRRDSFQRHVVTPQWPMEMPLHRDTFGPAWKRPYMFCYQGGHSHSHSLTPTIHRPPSRITRRHPILACTLIWLGFMPSRAGTNLNAQRQATAAILEVRIKNGT